jgi:hypothetical protein
MGTYSKKVRFVPEKLFRKMLRTSSLGAKGILSAYRIRAAQARNQAINHQISDGDITKMYEREKSPRVILRGAGRDDRWVFEHWNY